MITIRRPERSCNTKSGARKGIDHVGGSWLLGRFVNSNRPMHNRDREGGEREREKEQPRGLFAALERGGDKFGPGPRRDNRDREPVSGRGDDAEGRGEQAPGVCACIVWEGEAGG